MCGVECDSAVSGESPAGAFVVTGACGDWAIDDGGDEESGK